MKKTYLKITGIAFSAMLCLAIALPASAQRPANGGGGGTSTPAPAPARPAPSNNGGGGGGQRPAFNGGRNGGGARPSFNNNGGGARTGNVAPQQRQGAPNQNNFNRPNIGSRQGVVNNQNFGSRQGISAGQRGVSATVQMGLTSRPNYRSYPGIQANGVTRISGGGRPYAGYYNAHGYYNSFYAPHLGFRLNVLPYGYYPFYFGPNQYFYSDGLYYQYADNQYSVVEPPIGAAINTLPDNAQSIMINGIQYYELNGVYYQPITKDDGSVVYQVAGKDGELNTSVDPNDPNAQQQAAPQIGDIVPNLPDNCRTIKINGQKLYVSQDDYYFQETKDNNGNKAYKIVGTPNDEPNGQ